MTLEELRRETAIPIVIAEETGIITYVNAAFEQVFGWRRAEIVGQPVVVLVPPSLRDAHQLGFSRLLVTGVPTLVNRPLRLQALTKSGHAIEVEQTLVSEHRGGQWCFGAMICPVGPTT